MPPFQTTRVSLLARLRDAGDADAWSQFHQIYGPIIFRFARRRGLQDADAADLTQDILREVSQSIHRFKYDPGIGRFRSWLFTVARYTLSTFRRRGLHEPRGSGDTSFHERLEQEPQPDTGQAEWDHEYGQRLFELAAESVRQKVQPATWQAFWATAVEGRDPETVAAELNLSIGTVYVARSRVTSHLREAIRQVDFE